MPAGSWHLLVPAGMWRFHWETWACLTPLRSTTEVSSSPTWKRPWLNWVTTCSASLFICIGERNSIYKHTHVYVMLQALSNQLTAWIGEVAVHSQFWINIYIYFPPVCPAWSWLWSTTEAPSELADSQRPGFAVSPSHPAPILYAYNLSKQQREDVSCHWAPSCFLCCQNARVFNLNTEVDI